MRVTDGQNYDSQDRASIAVSRGKNAVVEIARKETKAPKCRGGNCEKRKLWHIVAAGRKCFTSLYGKLKEHLA